MTTLSTFGPVKTDPHLSAFYLPLPGNNATLALRASDLGEPPAILKTLRDDQMVSVTELYAMLPGLAEAQWKPVNSTGLDGLAREWITSLDEVRVNLTVKGPTSQATVDAALKQAADALSAALQLARDAMTGYWLVIAGDKQFTAFIRPDNSWWASEDVPAADGRRVSRVKACKIDANPHDALETWAATQGQPVTIQKR
jgi:hypothetical protein